MMPLNEGAAALLRNQYGVLGPAARAAAIVPTRPFAHFDRRAEGAEQEPLVAHAIAVVIPAAAALSRRFAGNTPQHVARAAPTRAHATLDGR